MIAGRVEVLRASDKSDEPLRCESCRAQFACSPTIYGERGPICRRCDRIQSAMQSVPPPSAPYTVTMTLDRETFGDRRNDIILVDV